MWSSAPLATWFKGLDCHFPISFLFLFPLCHHFTNEPCFALRFNIYDPSMYISTNGFSKKCMLPDGQLGSLTYIKDIPYFKLNFIFPGLESKTLYGHQQVQFVCL